MTHDAAPVIAAQALISYGMDDSEVLDYIQRTWRLDPDDARAAVAAAYTLTGIRIAKRSEH